MPLFVCLFSDLNTREVRIDMKLALVMSDGQTIFKVKGQAHMGRFVDVVVVTLAGVDVRAEE